MIIKKPNLFIVGAPKCGTSFLYEHLALHPQIFMSPVKEPNFFDVDLHYKSPRFSLDQYLKLFVKANAEKVIGEASPWYLYSSRASEEIFNFNPDAKIIIMLRNPVENMFSLHSENLFQGNEVEENFERAISLEEERKAGRNLNKNSNPEESVYYKDIVSYTPQILRYLKIFGKEKVHVIIFDDLKSNPNMVYKRVLEFLNVNIDFVPDLKIVNPAKEVKSIHLRELVMRPPGIFRNLIRMLIPIHSLRIYIQQMIVSKNSRVVKSRKMESALAERLNKEFNKEVESLSKLIDRSLVHWSK